MVVKKEFVLTLTYTHNDNKRNIKKIVELKLVKPQTQEIKLKIQKLQQHLNKLTREK